MARRSISAWLPLLSVLGASASLSTALVAHAEDGGGRASGASARASGAFVLQVGDASVGTVRAVEVPEKGGPSAPNLVVTAGEVTPALAGLVDGFVAGRALRTKLRLSTSAVVRRSPDAKLVTVKLPAMGSGGAPELELGFLASSITTQPVLSLEPASQKGPAGGRIASFRVDVAGLPPISPSKLDAITLVHRDGVAAPQADVVLEVGAGGAPPFTAWSKAHASRSAPRSMGVEYVGPDGAPVLALRLDACTPTSVTPLGASSTTRVTLRCGTARK